MELPYGYAVTIAGLLLALTILHWRFSEAPLARRLELLFFFSVLFGLAGTAAWPQIQWRLLAKPSVEAALSDHRLASIEPVNLPSASAPSLSEPDLTTARPEDDADDHQFSFSGMSGLDRWTAVYDISAHTVYLPNGAILEAHSGLGPKLDDPRYVHERMRGATPPHVYELALREKPFHGVRALRLKPIGGNEHIFGRSGLLAHTYMLGPKGDSNGCVVFKDYKAFLQAFENGEVRRLVVTAHID